MQREHDDFLGTYDGISSLSAQKGRVHTFLRRSAGTSAAAFGLIEWMQVPLTEATSAAVAERSAYGSLAVMVGFCALGGLEELRTFRKSQATQAKEKQLFEGLSQALGTDLELRAVDAAFTELTEDNPQSPTLSSE